MSKPRDGGKTFTFKITTTLAFVPFQQAKADGGLVIGRDHLGGAARPSPNGSSAMARSP